MRTSYGLTSRTNQLQIGTILSSRPRTMTSSRSRPRAMPSTVRSSSGSRPDVDFTRMTSPIFSSSTLISRNVSSAATRAKARRGFR